ncbi:MAG TPA: YcaO-like family protein [Microvirga sp.]|jgi:ribosomal protein S12 methylthiotransferase accessory factor|nr:YcaO-like family protein [Microvirga sp.]
MGQSTVANSLTAEDVQRRLRPSRAGRSVDQKELLDRLIRERFSYGITRIGCVTRLDRVGVPVIQVVRPEALSNAVVQGKGLTLEQAAASALMECLETWAGEQPPGAVEIASAENIGAEIAQLYSNATVADCPGDWSKQPIGWLFGWDLVQKRAVPVPRALVDTIYTEPSPHLRFFARTTAGLGAGWSMKQAVLQGILEILERHAVAAAKRLPRFFDNYQVDPGRVAGPRAMPVLERLDAAGLAVGAWLVPAAHGLPIYWCQVMENNPPVEILALPAEGYGCDFTHDGALAKALTEACQGRVTAISGAREDLIRDLYLQRVDRKELAIWQASLTCPPRYLEPASPHSNCLAIVAGAVEAARHAGAEAVIVVPLLADDDAHRYVVRVVAPCLAAGRFER